MLSLSFFIIILCGLVGSVWWACSGRQKRNVTGKQRMLDQEDMKWLAATATALNGFLQKATRQVEMARLCKGGGENLDALNEQIELASRASQAIFDRITTRILARTAGGVGPGEATPATPASAARASVSTKIPLGEVAANADTASDALILNPKGERELILLVDDDQDVLQCTGEILDFEDYRFILAKDGIEALQIYRQHGRENRPRPPRLLSSGDGWRRGLR